MNSKVMLINFFTYGILIGIGWELEAKLLYKILLSITITLLVTFIILFPYFI